VQKNNVFSDAFIGSNNSNPHPTTFFGAQAPPPQDHNHLGVYQQSGKAAELQKNI
jgi:hypothetical protein